MSCTPRSLPARRTRMPTCPASTRVLEVQPTNTRRTETPPTIASLRTVRPRDSESKLTLRAIFLGFLFLLPTAECRESLVLLLSSGDEPAFRGHPTNACEHPGRTPWQRTRSRRRSRA